MESLSQLKPGVAAELGTDHPVFQLSARHPASRLHHQQRGGTAPLAAQDHQDPRRISKPGGGAEVAISGFAAGGQKMDHAHPPLAGGAQPFHDPVAGPNAHPGESCPMNRQPASTWMQGKEPFPCTPSQNSPGRLHKSLDTPAYPAPVSQESIHAHPESTDSFLQSYSLPPLPQLLPRLHKLLY